jgi:hypothetical protein
MTITTNIKSSVHSTARLGVCVLIGVAALAACGQATDDQATTPVIVPSASTLASSAALDKQQALEVASNHALESRIAEEFGYVSPDAQDKQAMIEVASNHVLNG